MTVETRRGPSRPALECIVAACSHAKPRQFYRTFRAPIAFKKGRTGNEHTLGMSERLCYESCILNHWLCPDRDIESFLNHTHDSVSGFEEYRNHWIGRQIRRKCVSQASLRQKHGTTEANNSCRFFTQFRHTVVSCVRSFDRGYTSIEEALSGLCQRESAGGALQQTDAKSLLERRYTPA